MPLWRHDFASGLAVLISLIVILHIPAFFYNGVTSIPYVATVPSTDEIVTSFSEALGFIISIIIFLLLVPSVGYLMWTTAGRLLESGFDAVTNEIPLIRIVYNTSKFAVETVLTGTEDFQKSVRPETWPGIRMTAFKTGKMVKDGKVIVLMLTASSITTGFMMGIDPEDIEETGEKVEEVLTRIPSAGLAEQGRADEFNIGVTEESGGERVPSNE